MILVVLAGISTTAYAQDASQRWIFEGTISNVDPALTPDLQNGWILSGSFSLNRLELEPEPGFEGEGKGRLASGVKRAEISIDLYHKVYFEAMQAEGLAGYDYHNDDPESEGRDLMAWFFPVQGQVQSGKWTSRWLQVWLIDPSGKMLGEVPPVIGLTGLEWKSAWFRLTFEDEQGNAVYVDGGMEMFCPESDELDETQWRGIAAELSEELLKRDGTILSLREELAAAKDRNDSLRKMVDLLVQERTHLQEEITLLKEQASAGDPEVQQRIDELMADKSLLTLEIDELNERNAALAESLARSEQSRMELLSKLEDVPDTQPVFVELPKAELEVEERGEDGADNDDADSDIVTEPEPEPEVVSDADIDPGPDPDLELGEKLEKTVELEVKEEPAKANKTRYRMRKPGPRKFR